MHLGNRWISFWEQLDRINVLFTASAAGVVLGCFAAHIFSVDILRSICVHAVLGRSGFLPQLLCAEFPLVVAALFMYFGAYRASQTLAPALACCFLSFGICAMVSGFGAVGAVPAALLMANRIGSIVFLLWFLLSSSETSFSNRSFLFSALGIACGTALCSWTLDPVLINLFQSVFIST